MRDSRKIKLWSSCSLDLLKNEARDLGLPLARLHFVKTLKDLNDAEIIFGRIPVGVQEKLFKNNTHVRWIQIDAVDFSQYKLIPRNVMITNMRGVFACHVSESILGMLLSHYRGLWQTNTAQQRRQWARWPIRQSLDSLRHKKIVILGAGAIVEQLMRLLKPFECSAVIYRQQQKSFSGAKVICSKEKLFQEAKDAHIVINVLPSNEQTYGFVSKEFIRQLPRVCVFVNVGRGDTVDETALVMALKNKRLKTAILDVTQVEPVAQHNSLWSIEGMHLTQHTSGGNYNEDQVKCRFFLNNLKKYLRKQKLTNVIRA